MDKFVEEIKLKLHDLTQEEFDGIVCFMYDSNWSVKDTVNHIKSVRNFNKKQ